MEKSFYDFEQDLLITQSNVNNIEEQINYLQDIDSLILELRRIKEELKRL